MILSSIHNVHGEFKMLFLRHPLHSCKLDGNQSLSPVWEKNLKSCCLFMKSSIRELETCSLFSFHSVAYNPHVNAMYYPFLLTNNTCEAKELTLLNYVTSQHLPDQFLNLSFFNKRIFIRLAIDRLNP